MRSGGSLLASLEGMTRPAFRVAKELTVNGRSGLTVRFLSKKLEVPEEDIEYLLDVNQRLLFTDLTRVRLVAEGPAIIKRISDGLESQGDVPSLIRLVRGLDANEARRLEDFLRINEPVSKPELAQLLIDRAYKHPDSLPNYVASHDFSQEARELFDVLWQSKDGVMPMAKLRSYFRQNETVLERALYELLRGFAVFELFRFDNYDRLVRAVALLAELRQWRSRNVGNRGTREKRKVFRGTPDIVYSEGARLSETIGRLVAAVAANPVRLRSDGELFREDDRRLSELLGEPLQPPLEICLWLAEGVGWLQREEGRLKAKNLESLLEMEPFARQQALFSWLTAQGEEALVRKAFLAVLDEIKVDTWYSVRETISLISQRNAQHERPVLRASGAHWEYQSPSSSPSFESRILRSIEETWFWCGVVDRGEIDGENVFRLTELGEALLRGEPRPGVQRYFVKWSNRFVVQPNFDIIVPLHEVDPLLTVWLERFATRISSGPASVYHVSRETFLQAVQDGNDPKRFVEFLLRHNRGQTLPSNVLATLEDWQGAVRRVYVRTYTVIETEDSLTLADLMHRKKVQRFVKPLDASRVVLVDNGDIAELTKTLEKEGFVVET